MSKIVTRDALSPTDHCHRCDGGPNKSDAWWSLGYLDKHTEAPVVLCFSCTATVMRGVEQVPLAKFLETLDQVDGLEKSATNHLDELRKAKAEIKRLAKQVENAQVEIQNAAANLAAYRERIRELEHAPAADAKERLLAEVSGAVS